MLIYEILQYQNLCVVAENNFDISKFSTLFKPIRFICIPYEILVYLNCNLMIKRSVFAARSLIEWLC